MADAIPYSDYATRTAEVLTERFYRASEGAWWTSGSGFWHSANALEALIDTMTLTGSRSHEGVIDGPHQAFLSYFQPQWGRLPGWYDDEAWWGIALQKASVFTGKSTYYDTAVKVYEDLRGGWDDTCRGGVWFKRNPKSYGDAKSPDNFKGSISNELFMVLGGRLYNQDAASSPEERAGFLEWATKTWHWLEGSGLIDEQSLVWGELESDCSTVDPDDPPYTYTQGVILGGLCELHTATGERAYLDRALPFADVTIRTMTWPDGVLRERCETTPECSNDAKQFKGVFMRYLGQLYGALKQVAENDGKATPSAYVEAIDRYERFIRLNADTLWAGYPGGVFGMDWHRAPGGFTPDPEAWIAGTLQTSALDCFNSAVRGPDA